MTGFLWVCLGAAVGAPARYLTDRAVQARHVPVQCHEAYRIACIPGFEEGERFGTRGAARHAQAQRLQHFAKDLARRRVVIHDQRGKFAQGRRQHAA